ncbi:X-Pro dipeptidyl-peptidase family protein [Sphingopyxis sp. LC81]|uniref:S9 family peptidase n=1 Tax=Sphingopyxis sp. LC81 TaxID=1502850 RepID=UPI00051020F9|nr:alpha/beta fold hydrolase [Sphingopyxis sp. LC81]KGB55754.1 X-Pro dipeptidyl-peptidase family protein [Sphingopyxis sp. LC81]
MGFDILRRELRGRASVWTAALLGAAIMVVPAGGAELEQRVSLVPRDALFVSPGYSELQISPDGKQLAFLHPLNGVLNVWVAPLDDPKAATPVTRFDTRPPDSFQWSPDGRYILVLKDVGGEEHSQLWVANLEKSTVVNMTADPAVQTKIVKLSKRRPGEILVGMNIRDRRYRDIYRIDLATGRRTEVLRNERNYIDVVADPDFNIRLGVRGNVDGSSTYFRLDPAGPSEFMTIPLASLRNSKILGLDGAGKLLMFDSRTSDKANLVSVDLATGKQTPLAASGRADIVDTLFDEASGTLLATREDPLVSEWTVRSDEVRAEFAALQAAAAGPFKIVDQTPDNARWLLLETVPNRPDRYSWWNRKDRVLVPLLSTRPGLEKQALARRLPVTIASRDGLGLPSYLTLPAGAKLGADGMPVTPVPLVLLVHGGPWLRDDLAFDPQHAWLADRGYAVLSVNFRASGGFGSDFMAKGDRKWSETMHDDLLDGVQWAIDKGVTAKDRVAVMGLSYGGYSTLVSLSFTPDTFQCGVDLAGPSNLVKQVAGMPDWWTWQRPQFVNRVGDPATKEGAADLMRRSPIARVDAISKPLLVTNGANDPRIFPSQSEEIVDALKARGKPVTYAFYPDEGHVYAKDATNISFAAIAEHFLSKCLGGPAEAYGDDLAGSQVELKTGAGFVPGLEQALEVGRSSGR